MTPLATIPDVEALVGAWLREHEDIAAMNARVAGSTPDSMTFPWIRVTRLNAPRIRGATFDHATRFMVQLDCYAGKDATAELKGQPQATALGAAARAVLMSLSGTTIDDVAVSSVDITTDMRRPDTTLKPARERVILVAELLMHPA